MGERISAVVATNRHTTVNQNSFFGGELNVLTANRVAVKFEHIPLPTTNIPGNPRDVIGRITHEIDRSSIPGSLRRILQALQVRYEASGDLELNPDMEESERVVRQQRVDRSDGVISDTLTFRDGHPLLHGLQLLRDVKVLEASIGQQEDTKSTAAATAEALQEILDQINPPVVSASADKRETIDDLSRVWALKVDKRAPRVKKIFPDID